MLVSENNLLGNSQATLPLLILREGPQSTEEDANAARPTDADWAWEVFVPVDMPVSKLKTMVMGHFFNKADAAKLENHYRLLLPDRGRRMVEQNTVGDETSAGDGGNVPSENQELI
jgi:hypothetical protein